MPSAGQHIEFEGYFAEGELGIFKIIAILRGAGAPL